MHKRKRGGKASQMVHLSFGDYGLKSLSACWVSSRQIEAARKVLTRYISKGGKVWIRIFPDKSVTIKGGEIPMGKGKGTVDHYVAVVKPGMIMFEIAGITETEAKEAMKMAAYKLPVKCKYINK